MSTNHLSANEFVEQGYQYFDDKDYLNAILSFTKALQNAEGNFPYENVYLYRAYAWFQRGEYEIAIMDINDALRNSPRNADLYSARGQMRRELAQYSKAICDFTLAIEFHSQNYDYYYERSKTYVKDSNWQPALEDINTAIKFAEYKAETLPKHFLLRAEIYLNTQEYDKGLNDCDFVKKFRNVDKEPEVLAEALRMTGEIYLAQGNENAAHKEFIEAVQLNPALKEIDLSLAKSYSKKHDFEQTRFLCTRYLKSYPNSPEALRLRADALYWLEKFDDAKRDCHKILEDNSEDIETLELLKNIHMRCSEYPQYNKIQAEIDKIKNRKIHHKN